MNISQSESKPKKGKGNSRSQSKDNKKSIENSKKKLKKQGKNFELSFSSNKMEVDEIVQDKQPEEEIKNNDENEKKIGKYWKSKVLYTPSYITGSFDFLNKDIMLSNIGDKLVYLNPENFIKIEIDNIHQSEGKSRIINEISFEGEEIISFISIPKNGNIVISTDKSLIRVFDTLINKVVYTLKLNKTIAKKFLLDPSQQILASVLANHSVITYNTSNFSVIRVLNISNIYINDIIFSPHINKSLLFSATDDGMIKGYDINSGSELGHIEEYKSSAKCICITNDGNIMIVYHQDGNLILYDIRAIGNIHEKSSIIKKISFSPDDFILTNMLYFTRPDTNNLNSLIPYVLASTDKGKIIEINLISENIENELKLTSEGISYIKYNYYTNKLVVSSRDQLLFNIEIKIDSETIDNAHVLNRYPGYCDEILDIKVTKGRNFLFSCNDLGLKYYDSNLKSTSIFDGHKDFIMHIYYKKGFVSTSSKDGTIRIWKEIEVESKNKFNSIIYKDIFVLKGHSEVVNSSCIVFRNNKFFVISVGKDKSMKIWNLTEVYTLLLKQSEALPSNSQSENIDLCQDSSIDFSKLLNEKTKVIKSSSWTEIIHDDEISFVELSHNQKVVATGGEDKSILIWKVYANQNNDVITDKLGTLNGHSRSVTDFSFNKYAKLGVSSSNDKTIKIWNLDNFTCINNLTGHLSSVTKVKWIYYGTHILSACGNGVVKLWNLKSSENIITIPCHEGKIWGLSLIEDDGLLNFYTGSNDSTLKLWEDVTASKEIEQLREKEIKIMKEDHLKSVLYSKSYIEAMKISLELNHKREFFTSFIKYINENKNKSYDPIEIIINNRKNLDKVSKGIEVEEENKIDFNKIKNEIGELVIEYPSKILEIVRDNNIKSNQYFYSQILLKIVLKTLPSQYFFNTKVKLKGSKQRKKGKSINNDTKKGSALDIINKNMEKENENDENKEDSKYMKMDFIENFAIIKSYTEKHSERLQKQITNSYLIDLTLNSLVLLPLNIE